MILIVAMGETMECQGQATGIVILTMVVAQLHHQPWIAVRIETVAIMEASEVPMVTTRLWAMVEACLHKVATVAKEIVGVMVCVENRQAGEWAAGAQEGIRVANGVAKTTFPRKISMRVVVIIMAITMGTTEVMTVVDIAVTTVEAIKEAMEETNVTQEADLLHQARGTESTEPLNYRRHCVRSSAKYTLKYKKLQNIQRRLDASKALLQLIHLLTNCPCDSKAPSSAQYKEKPDGK